MSRMKLVGFVTIILLLLSCSKIDNDIITKPENGNKRRLIHVIGYGQSLMSGSFSGEPVSCKNKYDNLYMFKGGVRTYDAFGLDSNRRTHISRKVLPSYGELFLTPSENLSDYDYGVLKDALSSLKPLAEVIPVYIENTASSIDDAYLRNDKGTHFNIHKNGETVLTGFCEAYNEYMCNKEEDCSFDYAMLASCAAYGSAPYSSLLPLNRGGSIHGGSGGSNMNYFEVLMSQVVNGKKYAEEHDFNYSVDYILYFEEHTDIDSNSNPNIIAYRVLQLFSIVNSQIKAVTHQDNDIIFIVPSSNLTNDALSLAASIIVNGSGNIQLTNEEKSFIDNLPNNDVSPYSMDNVCSGVAHYGYEFVVDNGHHTAEAQRQIGYTIGTNMAAKNFKPLYPKNVCVSGKDIFITYCVPVPPIVIDQNAIHGTITNAEAVSRGDKYGYLIRDDKGIKDIIIGVYKVKPDMIKISCSESPKGMFLEYVFSKIGNQRYGNIRDSQTTSVENTSNWGYTFKIQL